MTYDDVLNSVKTLNRRLEIVKHRLYSLPVDLGRSCILYTGTGESVALKWLVQQVYPNLPIVHRQSRGIDSRTLTFVYNSDFPIEFYPSGTKTPYTVTFVERGNPTLGLAADGIIEVLGHTFVIPDWDWTESDVWALIFKKDLEFSPEHTEQRTWCDWYKTFAKSAA